MEIKGTEINNFLRFFNLLTRKKGVRMISSAENVTLSSP